MQLQIWEHKFLPGKLWGDGCSECEAQGTWKVRFISHLSFSLTLTWVKVWLSALEHVKIKTRNKKIVTQGRTWTRDMANGLPCSNQLSYRVTRQLSGWVRVLKAELPRIQPNRIPSWHVWWGGCGKEDERWSFYARLLYASLVSTAQMVTNFYLGSFGGEGVIPDMFLYQKKYL